MRGSRQRRCRLGLGQEGDDQGDPRARVNTPPPPSFADITWSACFENKKRSWRRQFPPVIGRFSRTLRATLEDRCRHSRRLQLGEKLRGPRRSEQCRTNDRRVDALQRAPDSPGCGPATEPQLQAAAQLKAPGREARRRRGRGRGRGRGLSAAACAGLRERGAQAVKTAAAKRRRLLRPV